MYWDLLIRVECGAVYCQNFDNLKILFIPMSLPFKSFLWRPRIFRTVVLFVLLYFSGNLTEHCSPKLASLRALMSKDAIKQSEHISCIERRTFKECVESECHRHLRDQRWNPKRTVLAEHWRSNIQ